MMRAKEKDEQLKYQRERNYQQKDLESEQKMRHREARKQREMQQINENYTNKHNEINSKV